MIFEKFINFELLLLLLLLLLYAILQGILSTIIDPMPHRIIPLWKVHLKLSKVLSY
jgi:hypothetical protein